MSNIWTCFTANQCPTLAGKPKMFFIQACRGEGADPGVTLQRVVRQTDTDGESSTYYRIPVNADFLIMHATIPGFVQTTNGKRLDILTLLTFVCRRVAIDFETQDQHIKQVPCITTMLTRILRFSDKEIAPDRRMCGLPSCPNCLFN
ncbi:uncharacterized protein Dwil_GK27860 [Drosophila willistoni]|uniref:Caspase family p20 domain-containing protein n=1 Tax=Drosophila willistoni TaxID=7260 RepID=A0A0Q9WV62_DROWI|nr:caspase [Drosophila willistoni]KRF99400.1 uncharacterized protein Dwil_GK27860 [Drosophila willistoni]